MNSDANFQLACDNWHRSMGREAMGLGSGVHMRIHNNCGDEAAELLQLKLIPDCNLRFLRSCSNRFAQF
jgi:hypothetical protein